jgi:hypothetical protein
MNEPESNIERHEDGAEQGRSASGAAPSPAGSQIEHCDQCGAPVRSDQRYCLACGAYRREIRDPAHRYLSDLAAARSRVAQADAARAAAPRRRGGLRGLPGLLVILAIALIPICAAVGVSIGRSSNHQDAALIKALHNQTAQTTTVAAASSGSTGSSGTANAATASTPKSGSSSAGSGAKSGSKSKSGKQPQAVSTADSAAATTPSASQVQTSESVAKAVQTATGSNYTKIEQQNTGSVGIP